MTRLQSDCRNVLLRRMTADDFARLADSLEMVELPHREPLGRPGQSTEHVYFPETGVGSITSNREPMRIEIGLVGREGFIGIPVLLGDGAWPAASFVQIPGTFLKMPADVFRAATLASPSLQSLALRYVQAYIAQVSSTAIANASFNVEQRLARWLLMASDRVDGFELTLTHEFLAMMLGVRRPGVTVGTHVLEGEHAIRATRGRIQVVNRGKLVERAGASYGLAEAEYDRLIGRHPTAVGQELADGPEAPAIGRAGLPGQVAADLVGRGLLAVVENQDLAHATEPAVIAAVGPELGPELGPTLGNS